MYIQQRRVSVGLVGLPRFILGITRALIESVAMIVTAMVMFLATPLSCAQNCAPQWIPGVGVDGRVDAMTAWDPDGPGGHPTAVIVGGSFARTSTGLLSNNIVAWNLVGPFAWSPMSTGINGPVTALTAIPNGSGGNDLVAAGTFTNAGGVTALRIARWDGSMWHALGSGLDGGVSALAVWPNGAGGNDLVAGGSFSNAGGVQASRIARWNGSSWSPLGTIGTGPNGNVLALAVVPGAAGASDLVAGGSFTAISGVTVNRIALWNGTSWSALGTGMNNSVKALAVLTNGTGGNDLVAGGSFTTAGGATARTLARWNGTSWSPVGAFGTGPGGDVLALAVTPNASGASDLVVGGSQFTITGFPFALNIARWDGNVWTGFGTGVNDVVRALAALSNGVGGSDLLAGGDFTGGAGSEYGPHFAHWGIPFSCRCDTLDFNLDGVYSDSADLLDYLSVFGGGACPSDPPQGFGCHDIDFNNDGVFPDIGDIESYLRVFGGGTCL